MTRITVFHNIDRDASLGLNRSLHAADNERGYEVRTEPCSHTLVPVYEYEDDREVSRINLHNIWMIFNVGHEPEFARELSESAQLLARTYRIRKLRSLSNGDVVRVGDTFYAAESAGWISVPADSLNTELNPIVAEVEIRDRFQFGRSAELAITVPLAGVEL